MTTDPSPFTPRPPELPVDDYTTDAYAAGVVGARLQREKVAGRDVLRPTIGRDSRIDGGVYEGSYGGEAIVVNSERGNNNLLRIAYADVVRAISDERGVPDKNLALAAVFNYVSAKMRYDADAVDNIFKEKAGGGGSSEGRFEYLY